MLKFDCKRKSPKYIYLLIECCENFPQKGWTMHAVTILTLITDVILVIIVHAHLHKQHKFPSIVIKLMCMVILTVPKGKVICRKARL